MNIEQQKTSEKRREDAVSECIQELFEAQVMRTPKAIALTFEGQHLTYHALNQQANIVAHSLRQYGIGPEIRVGLFMERSLALVVALLGVLKAGGVYVPLDPAYPSERLTFMQQDAQIAVLLTQSTYKENAFNTTIFTVVLEELQAHASAEMNTNLLREVSAENLAYIIYTSGSTGLPKGVQISHAALTNVLESIRNQIKITEQDTWLAISTFSFDIAALELFLPLIAGARIELVSRTIASDGRLLSEQLVQSGTTILQATPVTWSILLDTGWSNNEQTKLTALSGGEALTQSLAEALHKRVKSLWNMYGPTETTIWSSAEQLFSIGKIIALGRPLARTQIYLLNEHMQLVPIGVPGEVHIGGIGLARGYLNRPDLTAEQFVPHPFSRTPGARLYKTGDLARYSTNGNLEFLGRVDNQIKLRGYRIEPGEIEEALLKHPLVRQAVVTAQTGQMGTSHLIAYVVATQNNVNTQELRDFLQRKVPNYMVPSFFVSLRSLPLTPNGKVDRRKLPSLANIGIQTTKAIAIPDSPVEQMIAQTWGQALGFKDIGLHDNFFSLGGHSLLATQVIIQLRNHFNINLVLRDIFDAPTISGLASLIQVRKESPAPQQEPTIQPIQREQFRSVLSTDGKNTD